MHISCVALSSFFFCCQSDLIARVAQDKSVAKFVNAACARSFPRGQVVEGREQDDACCRQLVQKPLCQRSLVEDVLDSARLLVAVPTDHKWNMTFCRTLCQWAVFHCNCPQTTVRHEARMKLHQLCRTFEHKNVALSTNRSLKLAPVSVRQKLGTSLKHQNRSAAHSP